MRGLSQSEGLYPSDWILIFLLQAPSKSLDWQGAARPTGGAFVVTSGSVWICSSPSIMRLNSSRSGLSRMIHPTPVQSERAASLTPPAVGWEL